MAKRQAEDLTGRIYNKLTVLGFAGYHSKSKVRLWECKCECGKIKNVAHSNLKSGDIKGCGCGEALNRQRFAKAFASPTLEYIPDQYATLYHHYKSNAKKKGHSFEITKQEFIQVVQQSCYYCGLAPCQLQKGRRGKPAVKYTGIDRVDNTVGYLISNIRPCCKQCNYAKKAMTEQEFISWLRRIAQRWGTTT